MEIIDITHAAQDAPLYDEGDTAMTVVKVSDMSLGAMYNSSVIKTGSHIGSHADAFSHFIKDGLSIDKMPLDLFYGAARVISFKTEIISLSDISGRLENADRLIIKGGGKAFLSKEAADYLVSKKIKLVATDALSVAPRRKEIEIHTILFKAGAAIIENIVLDGVADGDYTLIAFPIKIKDCDGAPVRATLIK
ncbi:MAG: cyclase family protein [Endomicrobium sp.]|jgi:arylformamidase|nr:cyclase family protein [Endomicrobium sp.]